MQDEFDAKQSVTSTEPAASISREDAAVFELLVPSRRSSKFNQIAGMIAYAQYAIRKHEYIEMYTKEEGRLPDEDSLRSIIRTFKDQNSEALCSLRDSSKKLMEEYAEEYSKQYLTQEILEPVLKKTTINTRFWPGVLAGVIAAFIYSLLVAIVIFIATAALPDSKFAAALNALLQDSPVADERK